MASLENLLKKNGSAFLPNNSQLELSVVAPVTKAGHWILWPLDQKSVGAHPIQAKEERRCREEKSIGDKDLVPQSVPKITLEENTATSSPEHSLHPETFKGHPQCARLLGKS